MPAGPEEHYAPRVLIRPGEPVLLQRQEHGVMERNHAGFQEDIERLRIRHFTLFEFLLEDDVIGCAGKVRKIAANLVRSRNDTHAPILACRVIERDPRRTGRHGLDGPICGVLVPGRFLALARLGEKR